MPCVGGSKKKLRSGNDCGFSGGVSCVGWADARFELRLVCLRDRHAYPEKTCQASAAL